MSAQTMAEAWAPIEARNREIVLTNTWGHLAPKKNKIYKGRIVYAVGCMGSDHLNPTPIVCEFKGLDSSPWFFDAMTDFLDEISWKPEKEYPPRNGHGKVGCIYEWTGTFHNYKFTGRVVRLLDANDEVRHGGENP